VIGARPGQGKTAFACQAIPKELQAGEEVRAVFDRGQADTDHEPAGGDGLEDQRI
jgi:hypothetical protein